MPIHTKIDNWTYINTVCIIKSLLEQDSQFTQSFCQQFPKRRQISKCLQTLISPTLGHSHQHLKTVTNIPKFYDNRLFFTLKHAINQKFLFYVYYFIE